MYGEAVGAFALICGNDPLRGDLIRRFAPPVHLAVPENPIGLALILGIFDRCGNCEFPSSATGGGNPQFPLRRGGGSKRRIATPVCAPVRNDRERRPHPLQCAHWGTFPVRGEGYGSCIVMWPYKGTERDVEDAVPYKETGEGTGGREAAGHPYEGTESGGGLTLGGISSILKNTKKAAEQAEESVWKRASGKS